jgi:hypothetical protein
VKGSQYGEGVAIRNLVAKPVIEGVLRWLFTLLYPGQ